MAKPKTGRMPGPKVRDHYFCMHDFTSAACPSGLFLLTCHHWSPADGKEAKDTVTEELELELEALDIADEPIELEGGDEVENEELAKKLLDEQGQ